MEAGRLADAAKQPVESLHGEGPAGGLPESQVHGDLKTLEVVELKDEAHDGTLENVHQKPIAVGRE